jgi:dihydroorotase
LAQFVNASGPNVAATITPQHLHQLQRDVRWRHPPARLLPAVAKREAPAGAQRRRHPGSPKYFLGTDSAPHAVFAKGIGVRFCLGIFNAYMLWKALPYGVR